jgi:polyhydroxybutyrate depolymerase
MKKAQLFFFSFSILIFNFSFAQNINKTILVDDLQREYIVHLPPGFNAAQKLPVIFALHGGGGTAKGAVPFYNLESLADKNNFIIVYPNAIKKAWFIPGMTTRVKDADTAVDDLHFMNVLLDTIIAHYKVDDKKVFLTGISRGAMFSYYLADAMNARITAIAPVCGGISQTIMKNYFFQKTIPVLMINGTDDPLVKYNGGYGILNKRNEGNEDADVVPAEELLRKIVALNHCSASPQTQALPDVDANDGCTETESIYQCNAVKVDFIKIENGGHTWAGGTQYLPKFIIGKLCRDFSASEKIFDFFMSVK